MRCTAGLLGAGLLLLGIGAAPAGADGPWTEEPLRVLDASDPAEPPPPELPLLALDVLDPDGETPPVESLNRVEELPYVGLRPLAPFWNRLGLFAEFRGTTLRLRGTFYDVAGGASLFLREHLALTGSFRVQGYDPVLQGARLGGALEGPFFSLSLRY